MVAQQTRGWTYQFKMQSVQNSTHRKKMRRAPALVTLAATTRMPDPQDNHSQFLLGTLCIKTHMSTTGTSHTSLSMALCTSKQSRCNIADIQKTYLHNIQHIMIYNHTVLTISVIMMTQGWYCIFPINLNLISSIRLSTAMLPPQALILFQILSQHEFF